MKNIAKPVRVYCARIEAEGGKGEKGSRRKGKGRRTLAIGAVVGILIVVAAAALWKFYLHPTPRVELASKEKMTFALPDVPSIAVPFEIFS